MIAQHLLLTGYRGTGKSTVGKMVANRLDFAFLDIDDEIEQSSGKTIAEIFAESGEQGFRDLETNHILKLRELALPSVISLGGGAIIRSINRQAISQLGLTVWLQASPENIVARISGDPQTQSRRPKLSTLGNLDEVRSKLEERREWYSEVADKTIDCDRSSQEEIAASIVDWYQGQRP